MGMPTPASNLTDYTTDPARDSIAFAEALTSTWKGTQMVAWFTRSKGPNGWQDSGIRWAAVKVPGFEDTVMDVSGMQTKERLRAALPLPPRCGSQYRETNSKELAQWKGPRHEKALEAAYKIIKANPDKYRLNRDYAPSPIRVSSVQREASKAVLDNEAQALMEQGFSPRFAHMVAYSLYHGGKIHGERRQSPPLDTKATRYSWLPFSSVWPWIPSIEHFYPYGGASRPIAFLEGFLEANGDPSKLPPTGANLPVPTRHQTIVARDGFIHSMLRDIRTLDHGEVWKKNNLPTKRHLSLIAHAYSPDPEGLAQTYSPEAKDIQRLFGQR